MLTTIRQFQRGILIVVAIIVTIAFSFLYSDFDFARGTLGESNCVIEVAGRCYRDEESIKMARLQGLAYSFGMDEFADTLRGARRQDNDPTDFVINLLVLRNAAKEMSIEPSVKEIREGVPKLPIFDRAPWMMSKEFIRNLLGQQGLTDDDLAQLVKDYLTFNKMKDLIGAGVQPVPKAIENTYIQQNQRYTASLIDFRRSEFQDKVEISEEAIKQYFDDRNGVPAEPDPTTTGNLDPAENPGAISVMGGDLPKLMTEPKRGFNYLKFIPKKLGEDATQEQTDKAELEFARAVNGIYTRVTERGTDFITVAKQVAAEEHPFEVTIGNFQKSSETSGPEPIKDNLSLLRTLFSDTMIKEEQTEDKQWVKKGKIGVPYQNADGSYYIFKVNDIEDPREMTLEEARPAIVTALTVKESDKMVSDAAAEAKAKLQEAIKAGKTITEAAQENNYKLVELPTFSENDRPEDTEDTFQIVSSVRELSPGQLSEVKQRSAGKGYFISYVDKIEIYQDEDKDENLKKLSESWTSYEKDTLFRSWLKQKKNAADPKNKDSLLNVAARMR